MTQLALTFPTEWAILPVNAGRAEAVSRIVQGMGELSTDAAVTTAGYLASLVPALDDLGIDIFASLLLPDEQSGMPVQAFCAIAVVLMQSSDETELRALAEAGPHPGLERDTTTVTLPVGPAVRSSAIRFADELRDQDGLAPYAFELRFVLPLAADRAGILHFETLSLVFLEQLEALFDTIATTTRMV